MKLLLSVVFLVTVHSTAAQTNKDKAMSMARQAIKLMDNGDPDKAILLLDSAKLLDPTTHLYDYEIGYAYNIKKNHKKALEFFIVASKFEDANDQCFQMVGNLHDIIGDPEKAVEAYKKGLKRFPNSGRLYYELGVIEYNKENWDATIQYWEDGIRADPKYGTNYFQLAKLFASTKDLIWALFYGEMFMNVERNSKRTAEMSKLLYDTYKKAISFPSDTSVKVDLANPVLNITADQMKTKNFRMPFKFVYPMDIVICTAPLRLANAQLNMGYLNTLRTCAVQSWFKQKRDIDYPNVLLSFQKELLDQGHLEAYNYWILMRGNEEEFDKWHQENKEKFGLFAEWFTDNPMKVDKNKLFVRSPND